MSTSNGPSSIMMHIHVHVSSFINERLITQVLTFCGSDYLKSNILAYYAPKRECSYGRKYNWNCCFQELWNSSVAALQSATILIIYSRNIACLHYLCV